MFRVEERHTVFRSRLPGFGWLYQLALDKATKQFVEGLAEQAQRVPVPVGEAA